jgi:O-antigen/teichoic acid export membrane protein
LDFLKKIIQAQLFKIFSLNSVGVFIKIGFGLIISKVLAVFVGPAGLALVGNFKNFFSGIETVSTLGFQVGVTKYVVEAKNDNNELQKLFSTLLISILFIVFLLSLFLFFGASYLNDSVFGSNFDYAILFQIFAFTLPWFAFSVIFTAIITGLNKPKKSIYLNIISSCVGFVVSLILVTQFKTFGSLLAILVTSALLFFVSLYFLNQEILFFSKIKFIFFDFLILKKLFSFSIMALVSSIITPIVLLIIRKNCIELVGLRQAGYWVTIDLISNYYMLFVTSFFLIYHLPKLADCDTDLALKKIFNEYYKTVLPGFMAMVLIIYFTRHQIISLLFTKSFEPVEALFFYRMAGDVLKISSLILSYTLWLKKRLVSFVLFELIYLLLFYLLSQYFINDFGVEGILIGYCYSTGLYLLGLIIFFKKILF